MSEIIVYIEDDDEIEVGVDFGDEDISVGTKLYNSGPPGDSAYQIWLKQGNEGTVEDFLESLKAKIETYIHTQITPLNLWIIEHKLDRYPSVTVVDSGGSLVVGKVTYINSNMIEIEFSVGFSGKAYLN